MCIHHAAIDDNNQFVQKDTLKTFPKSPSHQDLCYAEQDFFFNAIQDDYDLEQHLEDAIRSLQIALACDEAVKKGKTVFL